MPWRKIVAQIAMEVGKVAGRAMTDALRKEFNQGAQKAARASAAGAKKAVEDQKIAGMTIEEAKMILNVQELCPEAIEKQYKYLFELNDKNAGGSFYLQSKVYRAKERLDKELEKVKGPENPPT